MTTQDKNYKRLEEAVEELSHLSPDSNIDVVIDRLEEAGFSKESNLRHTPVYNKVLEFINSRNRLKLDAACETLPFAVDYLKQNILNKYPLPSS